MCYFTPVYIKLFAHIKICFDYVFSDKSIDDFPATYQGRFFTPIVSAKIKTLPQKSARSVALSNARVVARALGTRQETLVGFVGNIGSSW